MSNPVLACDLGGTVIKLAIVHAGTVLARSDLPSHSEAGLRPRLSSIADSAHDLSAQADVKLSALAGVSIAIPGIVDHAQGRVRHINGKFLDAPDIDLIEWAHAEFGARAVLENDARAAAIGEWHHGAAQGCDDFVAVTLGTGIGVAAVCGGRVLRGPHGGAGILGGHLTVAIDGRRCSCGRIGCAEAEASTSALTELIQSMGASHDIQALDDVSVDYAKVFTLAESGDPAAIHVRDRSLAVWATLVLDLIHAYDPERVIVGGGIAAAPGILGAFQRALDNDPWSSDCGIDIVLSRLGTDAALLAAPSILAEASA
ncbi:MAG: ROK family protein [Actinobacteria bacterium]|nr:ROK family protein [Actinomycetota bacterium]